MGNPVSRQTWTVRYVLPTAQALTVFASSGLAGRLAASGLDTPDKWGAFVGLAIATPVLIKLYFWPVRSVKDLRKGQGASWFGNLLAGLVNPQPLPKGIQGAAYSSGATDYISLANITYTKPVDATGEVKPQDRDGWPVDEDRLRFWCFHIIRGTSLSLNYWTHNKKADDDHPEKFKIFEKEEYKELIKRAVNLEYVCRDNPRNVHSTAHLSDTGRVWCMSIISPSGRGVTEHKVMTVFSRDSHARTRARATVGAGV